MKKKGFIVFVFLLFFAELSVRFAGIADVPVRLANSDTGYIPRPSQDGSFLRNEWKINSMAMISEQEFTTEGQEILIAGDSVVFGGNLLDQHERVGERLGQINKNFDVYAIADGSWGFKNSLNYVEKNLIRLKGTEVIVFVLNSGDFNEPSQWRCESFHPTDKPVSHLYFSFRKYLMPQCLKETPVEVKVKDYNYVDKFLFIRSSLPDTRFFILLYQNKKEFKNGESLKKMVDQRMLGLIPVKEVVDYKSMWSESFFADGIHPNPSGSAALAKILNELVSE